MCTEGIMHQRSSSVSSHPHRATGSAARPEVSEHAGVCQSPAAKKEGRSLVCGTEESDRAPPLAIAQIEVRSGAVLPSGGCTEPQAPGPVPQPTYKTCSRSYRLETEERNLGSVRSHLKRRFAGLLFQHPQAMSQLCAFSSLKNGVDK
jgi:hypothetical protein